MTTLLHDLLIAQRTLRKTPSFTIIAILTLALGIGANTAIFTVVKAALLQPLPFADADRLLAIGRTTAGGGTRPVAPATALAWRARATAFESIAFSTDASFNLTGAGEPRTVFGYRWDANMLGVLGVRPALGRGFLPEDDRPGAPPVVLLSHELWQTVLGGRAAIVGQSLTLNGTPYTVIGVMPRGVAWPEHSLLWTPLALSPEMATNHTSQILRLVGRLKPGATQDQAREQLVSVVSALATQHPDIYRGTGVRLRTIREGRVGDIETPLLTLWAAVGFVLLIACANVSGLLLARIASRRKELALRRALGASPGRLVTQLLAESLLLAAAGGALGLLLAAWTRDALLALIPRNIANLSIPQIEELPIDPAVALFVAGVTLACVVLSGVFPVVQALRAAPGESLGERTSEASSPGRSRLRRSLVIGEVALALVLLVGAGLMIRSMQQLRQTDLGFDPERVLTLQVSLPDYKYADDNSRRDLVDAILPRLQALPGVEEAGLVSFMPLSGFNAAMTLEVEGRTYAPGQNPIVGYRVATEGYFRALRMPLRRGRLFNRFDRPGAPVVVLVNEALARQVFGNDDPIGRRLGSPRLEWQIVGIVGNARYDGPAVDPIPAVYFAYAQEPFFWVSFTLRTRVNTPYGVAADARRAIAEVDADLPIYRVLALEELAQQAVAVNRGTMLVLGAMAGLALLLAAVGLYGLLAFTVVQRTREIGVRIAIGADAAQVMREVLGSGLRLVTTGIVLGTAGSLVLTRALMGLLHGVSPTDPSTIAAVALLLAAVALLACYIPARRATRVDPVVALRAE